MSGQDGDEIQRHVWERQDAKEIRHASFRVFEIMWCLEHRTESQEAWLLLQFCL